MALPFFFKIDARNYFGRLIALRKYDAHMLIIIRITFQRIRWAGPAFDIAFAVIDIARFHNVLHLCLGYFPALHSAPGVFGIFNERRSPVEPAVAVNSITGPRVTGLLRACGVVARLAVPTSHFENEQCNNK